MKKSIKFLILPAMLVCAVIVLSACVNISLPERKPLATPTNLRVVEDVLYWDAVSGSTGYVVRVDDVDFHTTNTFFALPYDARTTKVKALGNGLTRLNSNFSEKIILEIEKDFFHDLRMQRELKRQANPCLETIQFEEIVEALLLKENFISDAFVSKTYGKVSILVRGELTSTQISRILEILRQVHPSLDIENITVETI